MLLFSCCRFQTTMKQSFQTKFNNFIDTLHNINIRKNFSFGNLHQITFYLFIFSIPLQTRITFLTNYTYVTNGFVEYNTKFLYLSDILLLITFILYLVNIAVHCNAWFPQKTQQVIHSFTPSASKSGFASKKITDHAFSYFKSLFYYFVNVSRETISKKSQIVKNPIFILILFIIWTSLSILWSNFKEISFYRDLKIIEFAFLSIYVAKNFYTVKKIVNALLIIVIAGNVQSIIAIVQIINQHSLGLKILGESLISQTILGVAKIGIGSEIFIRAYGTFPHPNVLAGFLVFTIVAVLILMIYAKSDYIASINHKKGYLSNKGFYVSSNMLNKFLLLSFVLLNIALILTFSRSAWFAIALSCLLIYLWIKNDYIYWSSLITQKLFKITPYLILFILLSSPFIVARLYKIDGNNTISDRIFYNNVAFSMISMHPLNGAGIGSFIPEMQAFSPITLNYWQYQPVHNIYLLIFSELGLFGIMLFICLIHTLFFYKQRKKVITSAFYRILYRMFHVKQFNNLDSIKPNKNPSTGLTIQLLFKLILFAFLLIALFDHYFWTIQQGQIIFWLVIGYILAINQIAAKSTDSKKD